MAIRIECLACNTVMNVADELGGKRIRCKSCQGIVSVPRTDTAAPAGETRVKLAPPALPVATPVRREDRRESREDRPVARSNPARRGTSSSSHVVLWLGAGAVGVLVFAISLVW